MGAWIKRLPTWVKVLGGLWLLGSLHAVRRAQEQQAERDKCVRAIMAMANGATLDEAHPDNYCLDVLDELQRRANRAERLWGPNWQSGR